MNSNYLILLFCLFSVQSIAQSKTLFFKEAIQEDLDYLYESLIDAHYNVYAYTSEEVFKATYQKIRQSIKKDSFDLLEATSLFQRLISKINNGHTEIFFPIQSYREYAQAEGTLFPLEIAFEDDKALLRKNWSLNSKIKPGTEVLSINGLSMPAILAKMYPHVSAEREYFKKAKIEFFSFPRLYWQVFGEVDEFQVEIREDGVLKKHSLKAIPLVEGYESKRNEVLNAQMTFKFIDELTAYLNPGNFSGDEQKYQHFMDSAFTQIKEKRSKNLIIDLRNNQGGENDFSDYLVSYLADQPFLWNSSFSLKTSKFLKEHIRENYDTTSAFWQEALNHENGEIYDYKFESHQPQSIQKRFTGKVYVLINRHSHSQAAVTAAQIQDYQLGTIVGEETGDYPSLYASIFHFPLPNTQILAQVSKGLMIRVNGSAKEEGVIPDIFIKDQLLDEKDEILDGLLRKIVGTW